MDGLRSPRLFVILATVALLCAPASGRELSSTPDFKDSFASGKIDWGDWVTDGGNNSYKSLYRIDRLSPGYLVHDRQSYCSQEPHDYLKEQELQIIRPVGEHGFRDSLRGNWASELHWSTSCGWCAADLHDWRFSVELQEGALMASQAMDLMDMDNAFMDPYLKQEQEFIHASVQLNGAILGLDLATHEYEYGLILSTYALSTMHFRGVDNALFTMAQADLRKVYRYVVGALTGPIQANEESAVLLRGYASCWYAFNALGDVSFTEVSRQEVEALASTFVACQDSNGAFSLADTLYHVQKQLKTDIALLRSYGVTRSPEYLLAVQKNVDWIIKNRWDRSGGCYGGIMWSKDDTTSYFECHQMWFLIVSKYLESFDVNSYVPFRDDALAFLTDDNFARVDMYVDNAVRYHAFFSYREVSRNGTIQEGGFSEWKGAYEIGASLWALALNYGSYSEGYSWLITQAPENSSDSWDKAIFTARDFGSTPMRFQWKAKFEDVRYPGAYTGLFNGRGGDWRIVLDTTYGLAYRDARDSTRTLVDKSLLLSGRIYTVTVERENVRRTKVTLEDEGGVLFAATIGDLKPYHSCYFGVFQDNGGALSAKNIFVDDVSYEGIEGLPDVTRLRGAFPNPFNPGTRIEYDITERTPVTLRVFDVSGRVVAELRHGVVDAGRYETSWDGKNGSGRPVASGVYFCVLETPGLRESAKLVLLR
jgi:hypothetical protein